MCLDQGSVCGQGQDFDYEWGQAIDQQQGSLARIRGQDVTRSGVTLATGIWSVFGLCVGLYLGRELRPWHDKAPFYFL